ncbi:MULTISPECIES: F-type conjugative transfer protein TrbC [Pseudomonas]|jgi:intracellular multiplication protein IcmO|uniref:TraM recognition domain-containing protein n=1 Tax=Pseudomonas helleri TaxID=1608996 RepID=A0A6L5HV73_9PSED|nr:MULTISPECIES: F-type conjugative transfer protein TrbC [Pseudomonas]KMN16240.1 conjugal transfer protein [Pseudomonas weihenstephanensis]MQT40414.1 TraM recognition domain-containing protein [Pseudomonas sp. FSL R10-0765]MQT90301.1 TraM recognition domain-containing protein [Pseudomonas helleri]MQU07296.1 TraM recognition domain-containing protein [Pseudomonas helleri]MQU21169.1 TraM recognition domain-containing protein [Pseudomonas helleri]
MRANDYAVERTRLNRRIYHSALGEWMMGPGSLALGLVGSVVGGIVYPASLWLSLPIMIFWAPSMLLEPWQMPMRMPSDMDRFDPSTQRQVPGKLLGFLPVTVMRTSMSKAAGILYMGYLRARDAGRELWLSMDDMTRHILMFGTTGAGKTEALLGYVVGQLSYGKGLIYSDGKAQNDVSAAITSLARRYGREDDVRTMSFITGGKSRAQDLLEGNKSRGQTNTINAFGIAQETYIINLMDSMLPPAGNDGGWQEKARAMIQALVFGLVYKCRREGTVMSQRTIQAHLPLRAIAKLYIQAVEQQWHEEARLPLENYLGTLAGFDLAKVDSPSEWAPEALNQHGYLIQQFTRMLALFNDTYGHVFALDAGDIDLKDVVHNDRILQVLIPALEISSTEAATLGRLYVSQAAMILSQDLGEKLEGKPEDILVIRKYKDRFPFLWILDEVGAYYTDKIGELATQVRSIGICLLLASQEAQRLKSAAGDKVWTLIANMGTRITGKIMDPKDTLEILQLMAGDEYVPQMSGLVRQPGMLSSNWEDSDTLTMSKDKKVSVEEVQQLQEGENITLYKGNVIRGSSMYVDDVDKLSKEAIHINRFIEVAPPGLETLLAGAPARVRRSYPRADRVQRILHHVAMKPGRSDLESLVLTDPLLVALNDLDEEWQAIWRRRPGAAVRSSLLWNTALQHVPKRGRGYQAQSRTAQALTVGSKRLEDYQAQHIRPANVPNAQAAAPRAAAPRPHRNDLQPPIYEDEMN